MKKAEGRNEVVSGSTSSQSQPRTIKENQRDGNKRRVGIDSYPRTTIVLFGSSWSECGYCQGRRAGLVDRPSTESSQSYTILVSNSSLSPSWYEELIHQGWRRSGPAIYKPYNWTSCCPLLSMRLPVQEFAPSKSQRKLLRKVSTMELSPSGHKQEQVSNQTTKQDKSKPLSGDITSPNKKKQKQHRSSSNRSWQAASSTSNEHQPSLFLGEETMINESEILQLLGTWTREALPILLPESLSLIPPNVSYKLRKPRHSSKREPPSKSNSNAADQLKSSSKNENSSPWTAVCTICAAISGRSRGAIDRSRLVRDLVQELQRRFEVHKQSTTPCTLVKIDAHLDSGQVVAYLQIDNSLWEQQKRSSGSSTSSSPAGDSNEQNNGGAGHVSRTPKQQASTHDVLLEWWNRENPKGPVLKDRSITIETMNAFESCLDPAVHRLYASYQHEVHKDPDPFHDDIDAFLTSNDEFRDSNGDQGNPWAVLASRYSEGLPPKNSIGDEGQQQQQQQYSFWLNQIQQMVQHEYGHLTPQRQLRLSHFVAKFCEYYVVSQFCTTRQQQSVTKLNNTNDIPGGTYHQHYRINGLLIAVGVLDILPRGLSSVYLFYNPSFSQSILPLGKLCAVREIEYCRDVLCLPYYYMGYYLHANPKMQYKSDYAPSYLLCPKHYRWVSAKDAVPRLLARSPQRYCSSLVEDDDEASGQSGTAENVIAAALGPSADKFDGVLENMQLHLNGTQLQLRDLTDDGQAYLKPLLLPFCQQAGRSASLDCIVHLG